MRFFDNFKSYKCGTSKFKCIFYTKNKSYKYLLSDIKNLHHIKPLYCSTIYHKNPLFKIIICNFFSIFDFFTHLNENLIFFVTNATQYNDFICNFFSDLRFFEIFLIFSNLIFLNFICNFFKSRSLEKMSN